MESAGAPWSVADRPLDNLPLELTSFIGREQEVAEVERQLRDRRLLTLCGPGGSGKTRLALAVAQELVEGFEDGVWWVELAAISDPKLLVRAVAAVLGVPESQDTSSTEDLVDHLRPRETLLVLDNCEHLIEACADLVATLLRACPDLVVLATSREPLRVTGESSWQVPSLSLPEPGRLPAAAELADFEAIHLFVERAEALDAGFELTEENAPVVARLCRELDGIPLAIELAAARSRVLTAEQILAKLEDPLRLLASRDRSAAPRQRTLRATLQWSYELLAEDERALFRRLSVFVGGWDLEAAEAVGAGEPVDADFVLDLLSALVDKSLALAETQSGGGLRYRMLEPVRQFAREKLEESGEATDLRRSHAEHYLDLAETAGPRLMGPDQGLWLRRLRTEFANLRETQAWSLEPGEEDERARVRLRLPAALWRFWTGRRFEDGKLWLQTALEMDPGGFPAVRARALDGLGYILLFQQNYQQAIAALEEAVALYKDLGDNSGTAFALANFGYALLHGGFMERVPAFVAEANTLMTQDLDDHARAYLSQILATAAILNGELDSALVQFEAALALCRELGDLRNTSMALFNLGMITLAKGDASGGAALLEEGTHISRELGDRVGGLYYVWAFGKLSAMRARPLRAATLWGAAEALRERMGMSLSYLDLTASGYELELAAVRSELDAGSFAAAWAEGRAMSPEAAIEYALEETLSSREEIPPGRTSPGLPTSPGERASVDTTLLSQPPAESPAEDAVSGPRNNLPALRSVLVGRQREIAEIGRVLSASRLLTLTGAGGCGKTRLALEVAREITVSGADDYPDGVWLLEFASLTKGDLVPGAVAAALGVRERPDHPIAASLVEFLRSRRILLVLDNCEHLIEDCARLVDTLLGACEHLRVLATSREALGVAGEVNWVVPSLTVPDADSLTDPEELMRYEAVRLFVERARSRSPVFVLTPENAPAVVEICRKLDGIPLAIELATSRLGVLSVGQISDRLGDALGFLTTGDRTRAPRQRTLRAALEWGYNLLEEKERVLFGRLSVFAGGWTLEATEGVGAGGDIRDGEVLDLLSRLVQQSLVVAETTEGVSRYRMLEPVRQYALELLESGAEASEVRGRHSALFTSLAEQAHTELRGPGQVAWMLRIEQEQDNLRAAMAWAMSSGDYETAALLGWALWPFWFYRGYQREGRQLMESVLEGGTELSLELLIRATVAVAVMAYGQGADQAVVRHMTDLLELSRQAGGNAYAEGYARAGLGLVAMKQGELVKAAARLEEALPLFIECGELWTAAQTHTWLGTVLLLQGDQERAVARFEDGLALARWIGDRGAIYNALYSLAQVALARGEYESATGNFIEGMALSEEMGDLANVAYCLEGLATVAGSRGKAARSARLFGAAKGLHETIGVPVWTYYQPDRTLYEQTMSELREVLGEVTYEATFSEGRAMAPERAIAYALEEAVPVPSQVEPAPPQPPTAASPASVENLQVTLHVFAFGRARVEKDGVPIDSPDLIQKPRELLYYLLSHPEGRTKEQIGLALWPEASTSQLRSSFHDTVFRLRRALGAKEWVLFDKRRYCFGGSLEYFYDVESFEENIGAGRQLREEAPQRAIEHLREGSDLYKGDFLEDVGQSEWVLERQDELRRSYGESLVLLGELLAGVGGHAEAADAYRRAISHDRYLEEAHRGLMRAQVALGEPGGALRHYEELARMLQEQLGSSPSSETIALYESLRSAG
jgi:non-specific serine/threonine protein kinase